MTEQAISTLRRRMIEDMTIRKFAQKTQHDYVQRVKDFASYLKRPPDTAKPEDVRDFQLHLASSGAGTPKINTTVAALRFFFKATLDRPDLGRHLPTIHEPRKVPVVLSPDEVARFLEAAPGIGADGLYGRRGPPAVDESEGRRAGAPAAGDRCGARWSLADRGSQDRRDGSADAARLGDPVQ